MMNHNALEDRLNAVRSGKPAPKVPAAYGDNPINPQPKKSDVPTYKHIVISESYKFFTVLAASMLYGYGAEALLRADWKFLGVLGVGFIVNHLLTAVTKLLSK